MYEIIELKEELYRKCQKALEELNKSRQTNNRPEQETEKLQDKEKLWDEIVRPYRNYLEKRFEYERAYAAYYFWIEYHLNGASSVEYAASQTLKEIAGWGIENEGQTLSRQMIANILLYAAAENKVSIGLESRRFFKLRLL